MGLIDARRGVEHAKFRIDELEGEFNAFIKTNPYAKLDEFDANTRETVFKLKLVKQLPDRINGIAFDIASNLRAALDRAGYAIAIAAGNNGKNAHFPFGDTIAEVQNRITRRSRDIPLEIFDVMVSFKPYPGGNDSLVALNKLCNANKHEIVVPMASMVGDITATGANISGPLSFGPKPWNSSKNEMEYARVGIGGKLEGNFKFTSFVAIGHIGVVEGQPAISVFNTIAGVIESILVAIEAEARRIGLVT